MEPMVEAKNNLVNLQLDEKIYPRQVVVAAAYLFLDRCYVRLDRAPKRQVQVRLKGKKKLAQARLKELAHEFENELLHQLIRHKVAEQTEQLREVIVGRALLSAEPIGEEQPADLEASPEDGAAFEQPAEDLDYLDDPLGIAVPWEEKYGEESKQEKSEEEPRDD